MEQAALEEITQRAVSGTYVAQGVPAQGECVVAFSFGYRLQNGKMIPGLSNEDLAQLICQKYQNLPKIVEALVGEAAVLQPPVFFIESHAEGVYLNTREVAIEASNIMKANGWTRAIVVAHPYHMPRVEAVCRKLGMNIIIPAGLEGVRFDEESEQLWTRNPVEWVKKEKKSIGWYADKGWI